MDSLIVIFVNCCASSVTLPPSTPLCFDNILIEFLSLLLKTCFLGFFWSDCSVLLSGNERRKQNAIGETPTLECSSFVGDCVQTLTRDPDQSNQRGRKLSACKKYKIFFKKRKKTKKEISKNAVTKDGDKPFDSILSSL